MKYPSFGEGRTAYDVLEVDPATDLDTIKQSYRALIRIYYPDLVAATGTADEVEQAQEISAELNVAWTMLQRDRDGYDAFLKSPKPEPEPDLDEGFETVDEEVDDPSPTAPEPEPDEGLDDPFEDAPPPPPAGQPHQILPGMLTPQALENLAPAPQPAIKRDGGLSPARTLGIVSLIGLLLYSVSFPFGGWVKLAAFIGFIASLVIGWRVRRRNQKIIAFRTVKPGSMYGTLPPDPVAGQVDQLVWTLLDRVPWAVALRCADPNAPFSHAVVAGDKVALLRGLPVYPGSYHWQGTTLVQSDGLVWQAAAALDPIPVTSRCRTIKPCAWTALYLTAPGPLQVTDSEPLHADAPAGVLGQVHRYLLDSQPIIRHANVAEALAALYSMDR